MITLPRRRFLTLAAGLIAAPVIVRASAIMPVKVPKFVLPDMRGRIRDILAEGEFRAIHHTNNPAVVFLNILQDSGLSHGRAIDFGGLNAMANYCEEVVSA